MKAVFLLGCCTISPGMIASIKGSFLLLLTLLSIASHAVFGQASWLTDDQARDVASVAIHRAYPKPCYSTYRQERLEGFLSGLRSNPVAGDQINNSVYFFRVASDACDYVTKDSGRTVVHTLVSMDCCEYGIVAVDRTTSKTYWFSERGKKAADVFHEFVRDENLRPDLPNPVLFSSLYRTIVWGRDGANEVVSLQQLRDMVQSNFQSAYSPYERDNAWEAKFGKWWRQFQSQRRGLKLETSFEATGDGTIVRGYWFSGFELRIPRSDPPPKGTPKLFQWALLIKSDGTVEEQSPRTIYSRR